ncbi:MAG: hypothetical protein JO071_03130 [Deltaproteobacteria bacterium]|nr:hypothetical protein [Deltaproteobacteria bacterium]
MGGRDFGVGPGDGDAAAPDAELAGALRPAEGAVVVDGMGPVRRLPVTMHISPEESQIKEFVTVEFFGGDFALIVGGSLGDLDDWAIATELPNRTTPVAIMLHSPLKLSILLSPPPTAHILNRLRRRSITLAAFAAIFCSSSKAAGSG